MTSTFWKWLSRANARTALLAAAVAFLVAAAYWVWRELDQAESAAGVNAAMTADRPAVTNRVQLLAFIKNQQENREKAANNPFYRKPVWKSDGAQPGAGGDSVKPGHNGGGKNPSVPKTTPAAPPPRPPREIPVLYCGRMTRPDGSVGALLENQQTKRQKFYADGELFLKATVEGIGSDSVRLRRADGATVTLVRGQAGKMRED